MNVQEQRELFQAVLAVAAADGTITRAERGLIEGLAERVGVGRVSLHAMIKMAQTSGAARFREGTRGVKMGDPERAMELLVATARIDGEIREEERQLLVRIAGIWDIPEERFVETFRRGLATADRIRAEREAEPPTPSAG